ncbi:MAG: flagellar basal body P-ring protein FlgI [Gammaproteobacteria bacterium]|nr:flagellar basal body P-ring protein FlgI [Gammaproteobacteria bacterium]MDH4313245.1 flagellar basal body P-ring protein FlgI [Gammaproteobacteria bacterium]MDH5213549.1 flagellar basal body P-ring protein FlgI [Gammaproteobacteria bacterium]
MLCFGAGQNALADRIKDLANVAGVRNNQLTGYGLVVGLDGTGDQTSQTPFTVQSVVNMLTQFGITIPPGVNLQLKNVAAVSIHADLPAFSKPGQAIDVTVASIGNAKSLRGGSLLMAPLRGADGNVYAIAQGNLIVGGFGASGNDGSRVTVNVPSAGRIPNGATVERTVASDFLTRESVVLNLHIPDFTTSNRLAILINETLGPGTAQAIDAVSVNIRAPLDPMQRTSFLAHIENLEVDPGQAAARVIINSRTGTVVIGANVRVTPAAVSHGSLVVTISEKPFASQPIAPFSDSGQTVVLPNSRVDIEQEKSSMFLFQPGTSLDEIVQAVNRVGAAPGDLVAILEALKQAGALRAELVVI